MRSPHTKPALIGGRFWLLNGRFLPVIAGAEEPTPEEQAAAEKATADAAAAKAKADEEAAAAAKKEADEKLGEPGKAALDAERTARKAAEKAAKDAQAALKKIEDEKLSETEKLKKAAEEGTAAAAKAVETLRKANLRLALAGAKDVADAKAAAALISGVEYDDDHEPTNLDDRVKAVLEAYPILKGEPPDPKKPKPDINGGGGNGSKAPDLTAEELAAAKETGMSPGDYQAMKGVKTLEDWERHTAVKTAAAKQ